MRCKFPEQDSTAIQCQTSNLSYTLTQFRQWVAGKTWIVTVVVLLGLGEGFWVTTEAMAQSARFPSTTSDLALPEALVPAEGVSAAQRLPEALGQIKRDAPQIAQAHTKRVDLSLERQPNETYETLLLRAEAAAREAAQTSFDQDIRVTDVSVIVVAQNQGAIAPVLSLEVNRSQWRSRPDVQGWITYFVSARALLQFEDVATTTADQPETANPYTKPRQPRNGTADQPEPTNPYTRLRQPRNGTAGQPEPANSSTTPGQPTNGTAGQPEPANSSTTPGQPTNGTAGQPEPANSSTTPGQPTNGTAGQTGTAEPTPTPSQQTPPSGSGLSPQPPTSAPVAPVSNPLTPTVPNVSPGSPSTSTPTSGAQNPSAAPSTSGSTNNNPFAAPTTPNSTSSPGI